MERGERIGGWKRVDRFDQRTVKRRPLTTVAVDDWAVVFERLDHRRRAVDVEAERKNRDRARARLAREPLADVGMERRRGRETQRQMPQFDQRRRNHDARHEAIGAYVTRFGWPSWLRQLAHRDRRQDAKPEHHQDREAGRGTNHAESEDESMQCRVQRSNPVRAQRQHKTKRRHGEHRHDRWLRVASPSEPRAGNGKPNQDEAGKQFALRACVRRPSRRSFGFGGRFNGVSC